MSGREWEVGSA